MKKKEISAIISLLTLLSCGHSPQESFFSSIHELELRNHRTVIPSPIPSFPIIKRKLTAPVITKEVFGFLPYWANSTTNIQWDLLTILAYFSAEINPDGSISNLHGWPSSAPIQEAHSYGVKVLLTATMFNDDDISTLINNQTYIDNFISNMLNEVSNANGDGICIDFELPYGADRNAFTNFINQVAGAFHSTLPGSIVAIATPAVDWRDAFDYNTLTDYADFLFIMAYDYHWAGGDPGPVSPLVSEGIWPADGICVMDTIKTYIYGTDGVGEGKTEKLILGLPYYGFKWPTTNYCVLGDTATASASSITYSSAESETQTYGKNWDAGSQSTYYCYSSGGTNYQTWYDDYLSLEIKEGIAHRFNLGGIGMWALNYDGSRTELWELIRRLFGPGIEYKSISIDDTTSGDSIGDGDGIPESGETIELILYLFNRSSLTFYAVRTDLLIHDPYISWIDSNEYWGNFAGGTTAPSTGDYDFSIASTSPTHTAKFYLNIYEGIRQYRTSFESGGWAEGGTGEMWERKTAKYLADSQTDIIVAPFSGNYFYGTNFSGDYPDNADWTLTSPTLNIPDENALLTFWHAYDIEADWDIGYVEISTDGGNTWKKIHPTGGYPGYSKYYDEWGYNGYSGGWHKEVFDISHYVPSSQLKVRFHFKSDTATTRGGWFIDDVFITGGKSTWKDSLKFEIKNPEDMRYDQIVIDDDTTGDSNGNGNGRIDPGETVELKISLLNPSGVDRTAVRAELWPDPRTMSYIDNYEYYGTISSSNSAFSSLDGDYDISVSSSVLPGEALFFTMDIYNGIRQFKDTFEGTSSWIEGGAGEQWERGTPPPEIGTHSGNKVYGTNLQGFYADGADWTLTSPSITVNSENAHLTFWHYYEIEENEDAGYVEISTDGGNTWRRIAPLDNYPCRGTKFGEGFCGNSSGWKKAIFDISPYVPSNVQIRFHFKSDYTSGAYGWYIDDVMVTEGDGAWTEYFAIKANTSSPTGFYLSLFSVKELKNGEYLLTWKTEDDTAIKEFDILASCEKEVGLKKINKEEIRSNMSILGSTYSFLYSPGNKCSFILKTIYTDGTVEYTSSEKEQKLSTIISSAEEVKDIDALYHNGNLYVFTLIDPGTVEVTDTSEHRILNSYNLSANWEHLSSVSKGDGIFIALSNEEFLSIYYLLNLWDPFKLLYTFPLPSTHFTDIEMQDENKMLACTDEGVLDGLIRDNQLLFKNFLPIKCKKLFIAGTNLFLQTSNGWIIYSRGATSPVTFFIPSFPDGFTTPDGKPHILGLENDLRVFEIPEHR